MGIKPIDSIEEFNAFVEETEREEGYRRPLSFGIARVDRGQKNRDKILQAHYGVVNWNENFGSGAVFIKALQESGCVIDFLESEFVVNINRDFIKNSLSLFNPFLEDTEGDSHKNIQLIKVLDGIGKLDNFRMVFIFEDTNPRSVESVYLKLYALSQQKVKIREINLDGAFGILENVAWVGNTPYELDYLRDKEIEMKMKGTYPYIDFVDKFPRYLQHIIPSDNTRILDTSKVRMGAQLAGGTTVMPGASYINFNAGTLGSVMVEGRISSSAIVGKGSDIGGGASILGVLSGTDGNPISIGENTLLGANSTCGIPLGDGCIIDGGLAIFAGTKVSISLEELKKIAKANSNMNIEEKEIFRADELQGLNGLHFRRDSITGKVVVKRSTKEIKLNKELH